MLQDGPSLKSKSKHGISYKTDYIHFRKIKFVNKLHNYSSLYCTKANTIYYTYGNNIWVQSTTYFTCNFTKTTSKKVSVFEPDTNHVILLNVRMYVIITTRIIFFLTQFRFNKNFVASHHSKYRPAFLSNLQEIWDFKNCYSN